MRICGLNKTTLLDYPGHVAATIFLGGCNFRCPFCQNGDLVLRPESQRVIDEQEIYAFLEKRKGVLSGGMHNRRGTYAGKGFVRSDKENKRNGLSGKARYKWIPPGNPKGTAGRRDTGLYCHGCEELNGPL